MVGRSCQSALVYAWPWSVLEKAGYWWTQSREGYALGTRESLGFMRTNEAQKKCTGGKEKKQEREREKCRGTKKNGLDISTTL